MTKTTPRRKPGPPKTHPIRIVLPLTHEEAGWARIAAERDGVPLVEWIRRAMRVALLDHVRTTPPIQVRRARGRVRLPGDAGPDEPTDPRGRPAKP